MTVDYDLTTDDLYAFQWRAGKVSPIARRIRRKTYLWLFIALTVIAVMPAIGADGFEVSRVMFVFLVVSFTVVALLTWFFETRMTRRVIREFVAQEQPDKGQLGKHHIELDDTGVMERTAVGEQRTLWNGVNRVEHDPAYVYIYTSASAALVVPKRAFPSASEAEAFYRLAKERSDAGR